MAVFLARMVMPRSFSRSLESMTRSPSSLRPRVPDCCSSLSTSVVLPWSTCAMMAILRIFSITNLQPLPYGGNRGGSIHDSPVNCSGPFTLSPQETAFFRYNARPFTESRQSYTRIMAIQRRAIALISGGLDSMLAVRVIQEQGILVEGVNFFTGFCVEGHTHAIRKKDQQKQKRNNALWVAEQLGIKLHIEDISEEYKDIVLNPKHGYGAHLNPCLDCKVFMVGKANAMLNKARQMADEKGFDFIITGEVIGQRPKSQRKQTMPLIARESGADDRLVRPLCAKLLPPTLPEREGWLDREKLYDFNGRNRKPQMALATQFGLLDYAQPAGGCCFLTDESYSRKLADLWQSQGRKDYELDDIMLLKVGRHIRPAPHYKLIVSREEIGRAH